MAIVGHVVVLLSNDQCVDYPDARCVMTAIQADSREHADDIARRMPSGCAPHVIAVVSANEYVPPDYPDEI